MKKVFVLLLFISFISNSYSQTFQFEPWETDASLDNFGAFSISMVESSGALWVGGNSAAVAKYENEEWQIHDLDSLFEGVSSFTRIDDIYKDSKDILWVATNNGIFKLDGEVWTFYKDELEKSFAYSVAEKEDTLYFSTRGGVMTLVGDQWGYSEISGNQPGFVAVDGDGFVWVSFANGDGNYKYVDGEWQGTQTPNADDCTRFALDNKTSPNGDMWIIAASGRMCKYDGDSFREYRTEGGILGALNTIDFSPSGDQVWVGGDDFSSDLKIKQYVNNELFSTYGSENGLKDSEVFSISVLSESSVLVFFSDAIYRGSLASSVSNVKEDESVLLSNLVSEELSFRSGVSISGFILNVNGQVMKSILSKDGRVDVSDLHAGIYFVKLNDKNSGLLEKFVKM